MASLRFQMLKRSLAFTARLPGMSKPPFPSADELSGGLSDEHRRIIEERRARMERMARLSPPPEGTQIERVDAGGVPSAWITHPDVRQDRALVYLHGGGYYAGSLKTHQGLAARIALAAGARVLLVDYRLAPEYPFPAAVEDATRAFRWLLRQGFAPERVAVAGDSAGGGLAVAAMLALKADGEPLPAAAACLSPWFDLAGTGESIRTRASLDPAIRSSDLAFVARCYLGRADPETPTASPLYGDLAALPPILIQVGTDEILLDDSRRFARKAEQAGVPVQLEIWDDMFHVWHAYARFIPEARRAIEKIGRFLRSTWDRRG